MKTKKAQPKLFLYGIIALITIGLIIGFFQTYLTKSKAAGEKINTAFSPSSGSFGATEQKNISVTLTTEDAVKKISGIDITFTGSGSLSITDVALISALSAGSTTSANSTQLVKSVQSQQARVSYVFLEADGNLPNTITLQVAIKGTGAGNGQLTINTATSQIVGNIVGNTYDFGTVAQGSYSFAGGGGGGPSATVNFDPAQVQAQPSQPFSVKLMVGNVPSGNHISGFDVQVQYDPSILQIISVAEPVDQTGATNKFTKIQNDVANGKITLKYVSLLANDQLPTSAAVVIRASGSQAATTSMSILTAEVTGDITQNSYEVTTSPASITIGTVTGPTPTPTTGGGNPTPTPTTGGGGFTPTPTQPGGGGTSVNLQLKLKFQGIVRQPASQYNSLRVQVMVGKPGFRSSPSWGNFTADANGIWSGSVSFSDVDAGDGYSLYIKGPAHLQKRICDADPIDEAPATYRCSLGKISLNTGTNTFDLSGIYLLTGDLPEQDGQQNGVVDAYDLSYVRLSLGARDAKSLDVADLNLDGIVDTQDYSLVIASLNVKYDEL